MFSGRNTVFLYLLFVTLFFCSSTASAQSMSCQSPFKGQRFTQAKLQAVVTAHQRWLDNGRKPAQAGRANLCGTDLRGLDLRAVNLSYANLAAADLSEMKLQKINLSHAQLQKAYFRWSIMLQANLQSANLDGATLQGVDLSKTNFRLASLQKVNLRHANLTSADLRSANLTNSNLSDANLEKADLTWANLKNANLNHANLKGTLLKEASLVNTNMLNTQLEDADFSGADLNNALFQPQIGSLPKLVGLASSENFRSIRFSVKEGSAALIELRTAYKKVGMRAMERSITAMVKVEQMQEAWQHGGWGYLESTFSYVFFYLTTHFGAAPGHALLLFLLLILLFTFFYRIFLSSQTKRSGIILRWKSKEFYHLETVQERRPHKEFRKLLKQRTCHDWKSTLHEQWRLMRISFYFSLLSAFSLGWQDLNVSSWLQRLQTRHYSLKGCGWVRVLAGTQSLISAYLIVIWVLTYFGRPFEW